MVISIPSTRIDEFLMIRNPRWLWLTFALSAVIVVLTIFEVQAYIAWSNYHFRPTSFSNYTLGGPIVTLIHPSLPLSFFELLFVLTASALLDFVTVRKALGYNLLPYS